MGPESHTKFERNPPSRLRDMEDGHARAHVQIHPNSDLFKSIWAHTKFERNRASRRGVTDGEGVSDTLSSARATCRGRHRRVSVSVKYEIY